MLPADYTTLMADLNDHFSTLEKNAADEYKRRIENITEQRKRNQDSITEYVAHFLETGVFKLDVGWWSYAKPHRGNNEHYTTTLNKFGAKLAQSLQRPFIRLYHNELRVPKQKQLAVITAPLKFTSEKIDGGNRWMASKVSNGVAYLPDIYASFDTYRFYGEEGDAQREAFFNYIREPECRKALRIPSL